MHEKALDPIEKHMIKNGNILQSLKEQSDSHTQKICTVFSKIDNIQTSLLKNEKDTSSCLAKMTNLRKKVTIWRTGAGETMCSWSTYRRVLRGTTWEATYRGCSSSGAHHSGAPMVLRSRLTVPTGVFQQYVETTDHDLQIIMLYWQTGNPGECTKS